jgi:cytochrome P450
VADRSAARKPAGVSLEDSVTALFEGRQDLVADPYPTYARLREEAPVFVHGGVALVSRYADVETVFRDHVRFSSDPGGTRVAAALERLSPRQAELYREMNAFDSLFLTRIDDPQHSRMRGVVHKSFTPRVIAQMRERVQLMTDRLLRTMEGQGEVDFIESFAYRLPLQVINALLGVPDRDAELIRGWTAAIAAYRGSLKHLEEAHSSVIAWHEYAKELVARNRVKPATATMSAIVEAEASGTLSVEEVVAIFVILLIGGHETTTNLLATGLMRLHSHPEQWRALTDDLSLVPQTVEELVRYDVPVQALSRSAVTETELEGVSLAPGQSIVVLAGSANRDPSQFPDPDRLDIRRDPERHVGFGLGRHFCLGAYLARQEATAAFESLAGRYPRMTVDLAVEWRDNPHLRGLSRLGVDLHA